MSDLSTKSRSVEENLNESVEFQGIPLEMTGPSEDFFSHVKTEIPYSDVETATQIIRNLDCLSRLAKTLRSLADQQFSVPQNEINKILRIVDNIISNTLALEADIAPANARAQELTVTVDMSRMHILIQSSVHAAMEIRSLLIPNNVVKIHTGEKSKEDQEISFATDRAKFDPDKSQSPEERLDQKIRSDQVKPSGDNMKFIINPFAKWTLKQWTMISITITVTMVCIMLSSEAFHYPDVHTKFFRVFSIILILLNVIAYCTAFYKIVSGAFRHE